MLAIRTARVTYATSHAFCSLSEDVSENIALLYEYSEKSGVLTKLLRTYKSLMTMNQYLSESPKGTALQSFIIPSISSQRSIENVPEVVVLSSC